jgi:hypothetical protein
LFAEVTEFQSFRVVKFEIPILPNAYFKDGLLDCWIFRFLESTNLQSIWFIIKIPPLKGARGMFCLVEVT